MPNPCLRGPLINFNELRAATAEDLMSSGMFPLLDERDALRLTSLTSGPVTLNISRAYVDVVKAWRKLLCTNVTWDSRLVGLLRSFNVLVQRRDGGHTFREECGPQVQLLNRSILLGWKSRFAAPAAPWTDFCQRVSKSGKPSLDQDQLSVLRKELAFLRAPCDWSMLRGRNGPGAVAEGYKGTYKWFFEYLPHRVPLDFFRLNFNHVVEDHIASSCRHGITRALQVPKDARGPRFISCEPLAYQHAQFAVKDWLERQVLKRYGRYLNPYNTLEHTRFLEDRQFCTIDLKDASDMVSRSLVWRVMPRDVAEMLFAVRSGFVSVEGKLIPLRTFAPMGSSLCFDIMQLIITAACRSLTPARLTGFHWFGDDGIVSAGAFVPTLMVLHDLGLKVNTTKCCGPQSRFRESCGEEWFWDTDRRYDVRPIYLRSLEPNRKAGVSLLVASQKLAACGFPATADVLDNSAARVGVSRPTKWRWNLQLQRMEILSSRIQAIRPNQEELDGYPGLYRWFVSQDADHELDMWSPRTRVVEGWFDPTDCECVLPRPLTWPTEVVARDPGRETINGMPLKEFMNRFPACEVDCDVPRVTAIEYTGAEY